MPAHPTLFLKKSVYEQYGHFDLSFKIAADYDFIQRIFKNTGLRFSYIPVVFTKMRVGGASNKNLKNIKHKMREDYMAIKKNMTGGWYTLVFKNLRKIVQLL